MTTPEQNASPKRATLTRAQALRLAADAGVSLKTVQRWADGAEVRPAGKERLETSWSAMQARKVLSVSGSPAHDEQCGCSSCVAKSRGLHGTTVCEPERDGFAGSGY